MRIRLKIFVKGNLVPELNKSIETFAFKERKKLYEKARYRAPFVLEKGINSHISSQNHIGIIAKGRGQTMVEYYTDSPLYSFLTQGTSPHPIFPKAVGSYKAREPILHEAYMSYSIPKSYESNKPKVLTAVRNGIIKGIFAHVFHPGSQPSQWFIDDTNKAIEEVEKLLKENK